MYWQAESAIRGSLIRINYSDIIGGKKFFLLHFFLNLSFSCPNYGSLDDMKPVSLILTF